MNTQASIAIYAPSRLKDADLVAGFVARQDLVDFLLTQLRGLAPGAVADHHLFIGQRGMGKTTLLRRLAIGIKEDADLAARYIPLTFREEQYNVRSLDRFWRNCGEALAEWCEATGKPEVATRLDRDLLEPAWADARTAVERFLAEAAALGARPVLFVDNIDLILGALPADDHWALRRALQAPGGPVVMGAATRHLRQSGDRDAAFYEFFHPHLLEPLSESELLRCLHRLADNRGDASRPVREVIARDPQRLRTLHTLTGGNPRVLALLYQLLERAESDTVFTDLEALLDQLTPFYKARVEEYQTDQQRAIIDAIALHWDPITARTLADATAIEVTTISSQLSRLRNDGLIEEVPTSGARAGYQLVERFFNIWYLMRHGTRRLRQRMYWLTAFLRLFYAPDELQRMKLEADNAKGASWHPHYREALVAAMEGISTAALSMTSGRSGPMLSGFGFADANVTPSDLKGADADAEQAPLSKGLSLFREGRVKESIAIFDDIVARFAAARAPEIRAQVALALLSKGVALGALGQCDEAIAIFDGVVARFATGSEPTWRPLVALALVAKGAALAALGRSEEEIAVYDDVVARFAGASEPELREGVARALVNKGMVLGQLSRSEEAIAVYDDVVARFAGASEPKLREQVARALVNKGFALRELGRREEAITACDDVVEQFAVATKPGLRELVAIALVHKGVIFEQLERSEEAIAVYDDVVARLAEAKEASLRRLAAMALTHKGTVLGQQGRSEAAVAAFRQAIAILPVSRDAWMSLGNTLADHLGQFEEAAAAYLEAMRNADDDPLPKGNLAWLRIAMGRVEEARAIRDTLAGLDAVGLALLDAALEIAADNFGAAMPQLEAALGGDQEMLAGKYFDDLLRLLRLAHGRGFGEKLIAWFVETGHADRRAPVHAAFVAFVRGERFLRDVSPEVRAPAEKIYRWLTMIPRAQQGAAESDAAKPPRRRGRRRKIRGR